MGGEIRDYKEIGNIVKGSLDLISRNKTIFGSGPSQVYSVEPIKTSSQSYEIFGTQKR